MKTEVLSMRLNKETALKAAQGSFFSMSILKRPPMFVT